MKHLIIEGPDRTGKDSLISNLLPYCQNSVITHFSTPVGNTDAEKRAFQENSFREEFGRAKLFLTSKIFHDPKPGKMNMLFWNRGHLGEFVYGNLYRKTHPEEWVMKIEEEKGFHQLENVYLLLLTADPEFLSSRDDGESFSASAESRTQEMNQFRQAFEMSNIRKKLHLSVDDVDANGKRAYRPAKTIAEEVLQFLNT